MIKSFCALLVFILFSALNLCIGQGQRPVTWHFNVAPIRGPETIVSITANLAPGWHLYSQLLKEGGPIPTRFKFERSDDYLLIGSTEEKGKQVKFYDNIYEMDIIWYANEVSFYQRISLNEPETIIKGKVAYMACNNEVCIPCDQEFAINVKSY